MRRIILAATAALSLSGFTFFTAADAKAETPPSNIMVNLPGKAAAVADAKMAVAMRYSEQLAGRESKENVEGLERWVRVLTSEERRETAASSPPHALPDGVQARTPISRLQADYWPFRQVNEYYCGPATVQSILQFLGPTEAQTKNYQGVHDRLTGDAHQDQRMLASDFWLATDKYRGTNWGDKYVPFALNAWRGTDWYIASGTAKVGGSLSKEQALAAIKYDTDRAYPVAENVMYSPETYYPAGFWPGVTYTHWDTIYGHYMDGDRQMVQVGQVYGGPNLPYERFQDVPWDVHWDAIGKWFGIVW
ncbi:MAG: hypothetical protein M0R74_01030 [Dehalococcoidia bacterium]|nr:hypothetical protein [Dehalococcoidia bacterium]